MRAPGRRRCDARRHGHGRRPAFTANRLSRGTNYSYRVDARFEDTSGRGERVEARPCTLTFVK